MGHIHLVVPDPAAMQKVWVDVMGGKPSTAGPLTLVKLPNVFVIPLALLFFGVLVRFALGTQTDSGPLAAKVGLTA